MQYDQKQFTQKGLDMFSTALSNKQSITVDKVIVDDLPTNNFSNLGLLSLDSFADAMSFQANYTETSNNTLTVDAVMSNKGFQSPYTVQEIGLVGHVGDDTSNQSLMAILVASDPFTLPAQQNDETPSQFIPNITIQLANNDMGQVPVLVQDDSYIAQKDLDKLVADNGYIKLTDADNRYVKQGDFQNEVNNSVNEKADKSDLNSLNNLISHNDSIGITGASVNNYLQTTNNTNPEVTDSTFNQSFHLNTPSGYGNDVQSIVPNTDDYGSVKYYDVYYLYNPNPVANAGQTEWYHVTTKDFKTFTPLDPKNPTSGANIAIPNPWINDGNDVTPSMRGKIPWGGVATGSIVENKGLLKNDTYGKSISHNAKLAYFTSYKDNQQTYLAYSNYGEQFKPYQDNPVIDPSRFSADFRDPCVVRNIKINNNLIMYVAGGSASKVYVLTSNNGINWNHNDSDDLYTRAYTECPVVKELNGMPILFVSNGGHDGSNTTGIDAFNGYYDNNGLLKFSNNTQCVRLDLGFDFYASNFANLDNNTLVAIGWLDNWKYSPVSGGLQSKGNKHFGSYSLPRTIKYGAGEYSVDIIEPDFKLSNSQKFNANDSVYIGNNKKIEINLDKAVNTPILLQGNNGSNVFMNFNNESLNLQRYNSESRMVMEQDMYIGSLISQIVLYIDTTSVEIYIPEQHQVMTIENYDRLTGDLVNYTLQQISVGFTLNTYELANNNISLNKTDELQNKTNDLSNTMSQQFSQAIAHADQISKKLDSLNLTVQNENLYFNGRPITTSPVTWDNIISITTNQSYSISSVQVQITNTDKLASYPSTSQVKIYLETINQGTINVNDRNAIINTNGNIYGENTYNVNNIPTSFSISMPDVSVYGYNVFGIAEGLDDGGNPTGVYGISRID